MAFPGKESVCNFAMGSEGASEDFARLTDVKTDRPQQQVGPFQPEGGASTMQMTLKARHL